MNVHLFRSALTLCFCLIFNASKGQFFEVKDSLTSKNTQWSGDTAWMNFTSEGLRTNAPSAGSLYWSRPSRAALFAEWQLGIALEFNPSSSNFFRFDFLSNNHGYYFLQCSGNSTDDLSLGLRTADGLDTILGSVPAYLNQNHPKLDLLIRRDSSYTFHVFDGDSLLFSASDSTLRNSRELGLFCAYTASRVDKFLFSTLAASGWMFRDSVAPQLRSIDVLSPYSIQLNWSEPCVPQSSANAVYAYQNGKAIDTAYFPYLGSNYWIADFERPLPLGGIAFQVLTALDSAANACPPQWEVANIDYLPEKSIWISSVSPFSGPYPPFITIYSPKHTSATLHTLNTSGKERTYSIELDSGFQSLCDTVLEGFKTVPGLRLESSEVLWTSIEGITTSLQTHIDEFTSLTSNGFYMLRDTARTYGNDCWALRAVDPKAPLLLPHQNGSPPQLRATHSDPSGSLFEEYTGSLYAFKELRGELWSPKNPMLKHIQGRSVLPDSGQLFLNEVHFRPDQLDEFVELKTDGLNYLELRALMLLKQSGTTLEAEPFKLQSARFCSRQGLMTVLPPKGLLSVSPGFILPDDSIQLSLLNPWGYLLDAMSYSPEQVQMERKSLERRSTEILGSIPENWGPHIQKLGLQDEASPNDTNSVAVYSGNGSSALEVQQNYLSLSPTHYEPESVLWIKHSEPIELSVSLFESQGGLLLNLYDNALIATGISGKSEVAINATQWPCHPCRSGVYFIHVAWKGSETQVQKIIPISLYNP